ncbi:MAG TPA: aminopeptidase P family protein [Longimicrobiales bacterium]|nr:aminopeptidase P family protein [Longimicrobiales bacterium]
MSDPEYDGVYASRRARVLERLGPDGALLLAAAPELRSGYDGELRYLPAADFYYLTGYVEPEAVLVLCPSAEQPFTLFVRPRDADRERWSGARGGEEAARERYGADAAFDIAELVNRLPSLVGKALTLFAPIESGRAEVDAAVSAAVSAGRRARARTGRGAGALADPHALLAPLRVRKDEHELALMRQAARITVEGFADAARAVRGATGEWQVEAALEHGFRSRGAMGPAFPSIVAGGANATVLHYVSNAAPLVPGSLLLVDAGARADMYCADVSRTLPVDGRFTPEQRDLYEVVRAAHGAALACVQPGRAADELENAALRVLVDGMRDLGLLSGDTDTLLEQRAYRRYYPHRTSHWLGLDVHDPADYVDAAGTALGLEAGMVLTIEPGLYLPADDEDAPAALRGTGIRLEDDVLVTPIGHEVLTAALPLAPDDVEALMGSAG